MKSIGDHAFFAANLTSVTIPNSLETLGVGVFSGNHNLREFVNAGKVSGNIRRATTDDGRCLVVNEKIIAIAYGGLDEYEIPANVSYPGASTNVAITTIGSYACANVSDDTFPKITIPEGITTLEDSAFWEQRGLQEIIIPTTIKSIGSKAFSVCVDLLKVYCKAITPPAMEQAFDSNPYNRTIYVPRESVDAYKSAPGWSNYADAIQGYDF